MTEPPAVIEARRVFMETRGVSGVSWDGSSIVVYVQNEYVKSHLPRSYKGYPVTTIVSGRFG